MSYSNGRGYGGDRHYRQRGPNRRRYEDNTPSKSPEELKREQIVSYLFRLGDSDQKQQADLCATQLLRDFGTHPQIVRSVFKECITHVPQKVSLYGTLSGLLNARNFDAGAAIIEITCEALQEALNNSDFRSTKILLRYIAELVNANVIQSTQLIGLYDLFLNVLNEPNVRPERADAFVYSVLASIPWAARQLSDTEATELERILGSIEKHMNQRQANLATSGIEQAMEALKVYRDVPEGEPYLVTDRLESLWRQIIQLKQADEWDLKIILRPTDFTDLLSTQLQHELRPISIPSGDVKFSYQPVFRIFDDSVQGVENIIVRLPSVLSISRFILDDLIYDIIRIFSHNHREVCRMLTDLETFLNGYYLRDGGFNVMASVIETVFGELLRLPRSGERSVYYATLLIDLIKEDLQTIPKVLGRAIRTLFSRLDGSQGLGGGMDVEAIRRFSEWFGIHLSNFGFMWKWQDWEPVLSVEQDSACFVFIRETLERCIRLSYWERVQGSLPEAFAESEIIFPQEPPHPNFKFESEETTGDAQLYELTSQLRSSLATKSGAEEISDLLQRIRDHATSNAPNAMEGVVGASGGTGTPEDLAREALVQCVMQQGSKSFSHVLNVVERYLTVLRDYNGTEEARSHTVRIIVDFWKDNTQFLEIILDKLMNYRVVTPKSILSWALDPSVLDSHYTRFHLWSIVRTTLAKVNFKIAQITAKLEAARRQSSVDNDLMLQDGDDSVIQSLEENRQGALREQKEVFLHVFQRFVDAIRNKCRSLESQGIDPTRTAWYRWVMGNMREVARGFPTEVKAYQVTLDMIIFTDDVDPRILKVWQEIKSVYSLHTDTLA
ncbi:uncharacterized protein SPPG_03001 [Spizellomyces punctatus DAOM BR117]|uniref:MIF4G domain-containing protein n=1 Tax=Spizellomyces punctatus (strain DAOM BR117) TaxID=645134 RepID=A0A0L0HNA1_SPIPD|nr:uncharacterized protein SPPG_03001 [Spizellomyces punctatus DAOM BR117]KND02543.1 hypothetical protein SPPG_03001 [Spizellomyces punctatus DAOM BR117]|eukprot:XP_016610582.1 hypothetical protein SPPG_03001 [Spizellomyces punctatus DAOM BR117]